MTWWQALPTVITAAALLVVPGLIFTRSAGVRGVMACAMAPVASCGIVGVTAVVGGLLRLPWSPWLLVIGTIASSILAMVVRRVVLRRTSPAFVVTAAPWSGVFAMLASLLVSALIIGRWLIRSIGRPENFSQAYDNVFHLNAIRYIVQTGEASSLTLGQMIRPEKDFSFYPSAWHSFCALIVEISGSSVFVAENALTIAVCALVWPLACITLVRVINGPQALPILAAGVLAASFWAFPYQLVQRGPLFPNVLSYALLPLSMVVLASLFNLARERVMDTFTLLTMFLVSCAALFAAQPNGFTALVAISIPILGGYWIRAVRHQREQKRGRLRITATILGALSTGAVIAGIWYGLIIPFYKWQPSRPVAQASFEIISGGMLDGPTTWFASGLALTGVITVLVRRRGYWIIASFGLVGLLYVASASFPSGPWRNVLVGSWYEDASRLAALVPLFTLLLAAIGVDGVVRTISRIVRSLSATSQNKNPFGTSHLAIATVPAIASALVLSLLVVFPVKSYHKPALIQIIAPPLSQSWGTNGNTPWISQDEFELMSRLDAVVPENAVIAVNPFNGGSLAYAVSGRHVSEYQLTAGPDGNLESLAQDLSAATPGSETCAHANAADIKYVIDFGTNYLGDYDAAEEYPGFVDITPSPAVKLVDQQGSAKLYELVGC